MGFPNPFKAAKKALTKVAKPFRKISKKFVPRELRWAAPYLAAATPFMLPGNFALGSMNPALSRGIMSSLANIGGQAIADPEGEDINLLSTLMAGGTGALGAEGMGTKLRSGIERGVTGVDQFGDIAVPYTDSIGFFQGAENLGREGLAQAADFLGGSAEGLASLGKNPASLFSKAGAKAAATDLAPIAVQGTGDMAKSMADQQWRAFDEAEAAAQAEFDATSTADKQERADLTMRYYREAGHDEKTIQTALEVNDLAEFYEPPVEEAAEGGIIGLKNGGIMMASYDYNDAMAEAFDAYERAIKDGIIPSTMEFDEYLELMRDSKKETAPQGVQMAAQGGIIGLKHGGMLNFGGREMDLRGGGFVPIGKKERADDVPARLSKNEFVMTADAVRAAGGGNVNKGAQRMYNVMNNLEARA